MIAGWSATSLTCRSICWAQAIMPATPPALHRSSRFLPIDSFSRPQTARLLRLLGQHQRPEHSGSRPQQRWDDELLAALDDLGRLDVPVQEFHQLRANQAEQMGLLH